MQAIIIILTIFLPLFASAGPRIVVADQLQSSSGLSNLTINWTVLNSLSGTNTGDITIGTANGISLAGQALSLQAADATHTGALLSADWSTFNAKEPAITAGTTLQYYRGDKSFQTLDTLAVPENTNLYFTNARAIAAPITGYVSGAGTVAATDTLLQAIQKLNGNTAALSAAAVTSLTGDVTGTGPGATAATIAANAVTNAKAAQMAANTIKGNNTGGTANALDLTAAQTTAMLSPVVADTYSVAGTQGLALAPPATTSVLGGFLAPGGWKQVDQSKPIANNLTFQTQVNTAPVANTKYQDATYYTDGAGNKYVITSGASNATMGIWLINNPAKPVLESNLVSTGSYKIQVKYPFAYIPSNGASNLLIYDITDPTAPLLKSNTAITGGAGSIYNCVVNGNFVYMATQSKGLTVLDATTITAPTQVFQEGGTTNKSFGIALLNNTTLLETYYDTAGTHVVKFLRTWDITTPGTPSLTNTFTFPGNTKPNNLTISPDSLTAYVTDTQLGVIQVVDITTPSAPSLLTSMTPTFAFNSGFTAQISGNFAYIPSGGNATNGGAIDVFDVTTRASPYKIATVLQGQANSPFGGIQVKGNYIFVGDYGDGITSHLDVYTSINELPIQGALVASSATIKGLSTAGVVHNAASGALSSSLVNLTSDVTGLLPNGNLANTVITVNGTSCTLGGSCTPSGAGGITALTGDVTATGPGSSAATISNLAVTNAKIANATIDLTTKVTGVLPTGNGGRGTEAQEIPSGTVNNSNVTFTLANTPTSNASLKLYQDGLILIQGTDYTLSGATITMTVAPNFGQALYADYTF